MIDVLLSVKNGESYIRESVMSILHQTHKNFTFYIIDDASTDDTLKILQSISDKRIKLKVFKKSQGLTKNLNSLLLEGRGEFVARLDADDVSSFDRFERELRFLEKTNSDLVGSYANLIDSAGKKIGERKYRGHDLKKDLIKFNMFPHSSWFGKREVFQELHGYNEKYKYAQDYDFLLRAVAKYKLNICPENLVNLRWDKNSLSLKNLKEQQKFALLARHEAIARGTYSKMNYIFLLKPLISYLIPSGVNKIIYKFIM